MFSILICTRNSNRVLSEVVESITSQSRLDLIDELIIIDYNSTDNTIDIIKEKLIYFKLKLTIKYIYIPGKSNALIAGLNISNSSYTVILDDDNILDNEYIKNASNILSINKNIGCLGSFGICDPTQIYPTWFDEYKSAFAIGLPKQGSNKDWVWGAASIVKMECWNKLKKSNFKFLLEVERKGHNIPVKIGGEDVELSLAIKKIGYDIDFSESLIFTHKFDASRLCKSYLILNNKGVSASVPIHEIYRSFIYNRKILKYGQIVVHLRIYKKIGTSFFNLLKSILNGKVLAIKMNFSTFVGIFNGYFYFFSDLKKYSLIIENLK